MTHAEKMHLRGLYAAHWDAVQSYEKGTCDFSLVHATSLAIKRFRAECIVRREMS